MSRARHGRGEPSRSLCARPVTPGLTRDDRSRQLPTDQDHASLSPSGITREYQTDQPSPTASPWSPGLSRDGPENDEAAQKKESGIDWLVHIRDQTPFLTLGPRIAVRARVFDGAGRADLSEGPDGPLRGPSCRPAVKNPRAGDPGCPWGIQGGYWASNSPLGRGAGEEPPRTGAGFE